MKRINKILWLILAFSLLVSSRVFAAAVPKPVMKANDSVVRILTSYSNGDMASGSGFVVSGDKDYTYIVTNWHVAVMDDPTYISVILNLEAEINASVAAFDEGRDLAVLKVAMPLGIDPLKLSKESAQKGDGIYAIGFPGGADYLTDNFAANKEDTTITDGIVSALRKATLTENGFQTELLQISAAINHGNSGGPVLDEKGYVVGVSTYSITDATDINGAVSVTEVISFLQENGIPFNTGSVSPMINPMMIIGVLAILGIILIMVLLGRRKKNPISVTEEIGLYETSPEQIISTSVAPAKKKRNPIRLKIAIQIFLAVAVISVGVYGVIGYSNTMKQIQAGDFNGVNPLFFQLACKVDSNLASYADALRMFQSGDYDGAEEAFSALSGYRNSDDLVLECRYKRGKKLFESQDYKEALSIFESLGDYSDSADMVFEIEYAKAAKLFDTGSDIAGLHAMKNLSDEGFTKAEETLPLLQEKLYNNAVQYYRTDLLDAAQKRFAEIPGYNRASDYDFLCKIKSDATTGSSSSPERQAYTAALMKLDTDRCLGMLDFEDAATVIFWDTDHAEYFLNGNWKTTDGYYFRMDSNEVHHNFPSPVEGGSYSFSKGTYKVLKGDYIYSVFDFRVVDRNRISVFCRENHRTYLLYRE